MRSRADQTAARALADEMRRLGHKHPDAAAAYSVELGQGSCRHPFTIEQIQTSLLGGEDLQKICTRCGAIVSSEVAS